MRLKLLGIICFLIRVSIVNGQNFTGVWQGNLDINGNLVPIIFHIKSDGANNLVAVFDSPEQKAFGLPCNGITVKGDSIIILIKMIQGFYSASTIVWIL